MRHVGEQVSVSARLPLEELTEEELVARCRVGAGAPHRSPSEAATRRRPRPGDRDGRTRRGSRRETAGGDSGQTADAEHSVPLDETAANL